MNTPNYPREGALLVTIAMLSGIEFLQNGMISFASGPIFGQINGSAEEFTLATVVYAVFAIASLAKQRWLTERMGWRLFLQAAVVIYVAGAAICASSSAFPQFLLGRAVMGLGGGQFLTAARVMVNLIPPSPRRFRGILAFAGALTIGNGAAPWLASLAVSHDSAAEIFLLLACLAAIAGAVGTIALPNRVTPVEERTRSQPLMMLVMMAGTFLTLYAFLRAPYDFFSSGWPLLLTFMTGIGALILFGHHQHGHQRPLLILKRLMIPRYLAGIATFTLGYMILGANNYMLPILMQGGLGFPWEVVGKVQSAGLLVALPTFGIMATVLKRNQSAKKFYVTGFILLMLSSLFLTRLNGEAALWTDVLPGIMLFGAFITPVMVTTALHSFMDLMKDEVAFSNGQQLKNMLSQFGVSMGVAGAALGLQWRSAAHLATLVERFTPDNQTFNSLTGQLAEQLGASHGALAPQMAVGSLAQQVPQQAILLSSLDYFGFLAALGLMGALVMVTQRVLK